MDIKGDTMMMLSKENDIWYSDSHFSIMDGEIYEKETLAPKGEVVRIIENNSYMPLGTKRKPTLINRVRTLLRDAFYVPEHHIRPIPEKSDGSLAETMKHLERK